MDRAKSERERGREREGVRGVWQGGSAEETSRARHRDDAKRNQEKNKGKRRTVGICRIETCFLAKGLSPSKLSTKALCRDTRKRGDMRERERDRQNWRERMQERERERERQEGDGYRDTERQGARERQGERDREHAKGGPGMATLIRN